MAYCGNVGSSKGREIFANIVRWLTFTIGVLSIILGIISVCQHKVELSMDKDDFLEDTNVDSWRLVFSLDPNSLGYSWSPCIVGLVTLFGFISYMHITFFCKTFLRLAVWLFIVAMFGNMGFCGGLGIIIASITLLVCLLSLIASFLHDGPAYFVFTRNMKWTVEEPQPAAA